MNFYRKINTIKNFRAVTGFGLRESKDLIDTAQDTGMLAQAYREAGDVDAESLALMRLCYLVGRAVEKGHSPDDIRDMLKAVHGGERQHDLRALVERTLQVS